MARKKTKQQKIIASTKVAEIPKNTATQFSQSQVSLVYTDLLKTLIVSTLVFAVLLCIFVYLG